MSPQRRVRGGRVRWVGRFRDAAGRERSRTFDLKTDAARWEVEQRRRVRLGDTVPPDSSVTVGELVAEWRDTATKPNTRISRNHLWQNLGPLTDAPVSAVDARMIETWAETLAAGRPWVNRRALSPSTVSLLTGMLLTVLRRAHRHGQIRAVPTVEKRALTQEAVRRADIPLPDDVDGFARAAITPYPRSPARPWLARMIYVLSGTGLRISELCGLCVQDVDTARMVIHVRQQASSDGRRLVGLKTPAAARTVPIPEPVAAMLTEQIAETGTSRLGTVWARRGGWAMRGSTVTGQMRDLARTRRAFPVNPHLLRHYYASGLIAGRATVTDVQHALGHETPDITMRTYARLFDGSEDRVRAAAEMLARDWCGTGPGDVT